MGKKKKDKKGKGAEKTAQKTELKAEKKMKKILKEKGEDDVEALIAEFLERDKKLTSVVEEGCPPPSQRCNMSFTAHPEKDELIMFGGEYFNGSKTVMYNDLLFYNIKNNEWTKLVAPNPPSPRCAHQIVALMQGGGQLWMFGGEFASPTGSQFHHYKELWCFHLREKRWEKISAANAPSSRSGHRMVACKRQLIVFGGFHDNVADYKYYNDVHGFNLDTFTWCKLTVSGHGPAPRSASQMGVLHDQRHLLVYGGYSKERQKRDVDQGKVHTDMFLLQPDDKNKEDPAPTKWRWTGVKQSGVKPPPRCSFSMAITPGNRAVVFGGVFDKEEDEEHMEGIFYNDMYNLDLETGKWSEVTLRGKKDKDKKRRRKRKEGGDAVEEDMEEDEDGDLGDAVDEALEQLKVDETTYDDGVFTVTVGGGAAVVAAPGGGVGKLVEKVFTPCPRGGAVTAVKHSVLYLYGGMYEDGDKQVTLADMYSLDLHRLDVWNTIIEDDISKKEWIESDDSWQTDDEDDDEEGAAGGKSKVGNDEDDDSDGTSDEEGDAPDVRHGEDLTDFFGRTRDFWLESADCRADKAGVELLGKALKKEAFSMAEQHFKAQTAK